MILKFQQRRLGNRFLHHVHAPMSFSYFSFVICKDGGKMQEPCMQSEKSIPQPPCVPSHLLNVLLLFDVLSAVGVSYFIAFRPHRPRGRPKGSAKAQSKRKATPETSEKLAGKAKAKAGPKPKAKCKAKAKSKPAGTAYGKRKPAGKAYGKCKQEGKAKARKTKKSEKELKQDWNNVYCRMYHALRKKGSSKDEARLVFVHASTFNVVSWFTSTSKHPGVSADSIGRQGRQQRQLHRELQRKLRPLAVTSRQKQMGSHGTYTVWTRCDQRGTE